MIAVIADDFSGAVEIGGIGCRLGMKTTVSTAVFADSSVDLMVIDADTRSLSATEAALVTRSIAREIESLEPDWRFKKIDSVLRGHVIAEIEALSEVTGRDRVCVIPANPALRRIIKDGVYRINGRPIHETDFARDPEYPANTSIVRDMLGASGVFDILTSCRPEPLAENTVTVGDTESEDDLLHWASQVDTRTAIACGSAAFFTALLEKSGITRHFDRVKDSPAVDSSYIMVCGSNSEYSRTFRDTARAQGIPMYEIPTEDIHAARPIDDVIRRHSDEIMDTMNRNRGLILAIRDDLGPGHNTCGLYAGLVQSILAGMQIPELYIEGGATASAIVRGMKWSRFTPCAELRPGVVRMRVEDGPECTITIKPGSYPWPDDMFVRLS